MASPELSIVIPVFNEAANIGPLCARLIPVVESVASSFEIVFVDDGSRDETLARIKAESGRDPRIGAVSFSRNFGKEIAIAAGLDHARGAAVVIMDADLQHPPEMIATFVEKWRRGLHHGLRPAHRPFGGDAHQAAARRISSTACSSASARSACRRAPAISASSTARASR